MQRSDVRDDDEDDLPRGERVSKKQVMRYRGHAHDRSKDALGRTIWALDRIVVIASLLALLAAALVVAIELGRSGEEYDGLREIGSVGRLALACLNRIWPLLAVALGAWAVARFVRGVTGRA
jgi:hypothetical protein